MKGKIEIEWLFDSEHCETCGTNWAEGARVKLDGQTILELEPVATCFGGYNWTPTEVYRRIIIELGYTIDEGED